MDILILFAVMAAILAAFIHLDNMNADTKEACRSIGMETIYLSHEGARCVPIGVLVDPSRSQ